MNDKGIKARFFRKNLVYMKNLKKVQIGRDGLNFIRFLYYSWLALCKKCLSGKILDFSLWILNQKGLNQQPTAPFSTCVHPFPLPYCLQPPTSTALSVVLFLWLIQRLCNIWCAVLLYNIMGLHVSDLGTLAPEEPWCVFYATRHQVYWGLTHNVVFS